MIVIFFCFSPLKTFVLLFSLFDEMEKKFIFPSLLLIFMF